MEEKNESPNSSKILVNFTTKKKKEKIILIHALQFVNWADHFNEGVMVINRQYHQFPSIKARKKEKFMRKNPFLLMLHLI